MNSYIIDAPQIQGQDPQGLGPVYQNANAQQQYMNSQLGQANQLSQYHSYGSGGGGNNIALALALRKMGGNTDIPSANLAQMSGVDGMGGSMGTGLTQDSYNSGIGFYPSAQSGGYGMKF